MCFSASASIGSSIVLASLGALTLKSAKSNRQLFYLALIPCLFAFEQFSEGMVWLSAEGIQPSAPIFELFKYIFLFFALALWPTWIPFALLMAENQPKRRFLLSLTLAFGVALAGYDLYLVYVQKPDAHIFFNSIQYSIQLPDLLWLYYVPTVIPTLISSLRGMWVYGILVLIMAPAANYLYHDTFLSVWCFFSAIVSLCLIKILRDNATVPVKQEVKIKEKE